MMASDENTNFLNLSIWLLILYLRMVLGNHSLQLVSKQFLEQWGFFDISVSCLLISLLSFMRKYKITLCHLLLKAYEGHYCYYSISISMYSRSMWVYSHSSNSPIVWEEWNRKSTHALQCSVKFEFA